MSSHMASYASKRAIALRRSRFNLRAAFFAIAAGSLTVMSPQAALAQAINPTSADGQVGSPIELISTLNNTVEDVTVSGLPADAVLSAGTQDAGDPTVWVVPAAAFSSGSPVTFTSSTRGTYNITFSQETNGNQFTAFEDGTFGSGAAT